MEEGRLTIGARKYKEYESVDVGEDERVRYRGLHHGASYLEHLDLLDCIRNGGPPRVTATDGMMAVAIGIAIDTCYASLALGLDRDDAGRVPACLGRLGFVAAMAICALLARRLLRPESPVSRDFRAGFRKSWADAMRLAGYPLAVGVPVALGVLALAGYYYTAQQLALRMATTVYVLFGVILLRSLALRWVFVRRRRLAIEQARQRRAARQAESEAGAEGEAGSGLPATAAPPEVDLAAIDSQTRHLIEYSLAVTGLLQTFSSLSLVGLVVQFLALAVERYRNAIVNTLIDLLAPQGIFERSDVEVREREGLVPLTGPVWGEVPPDLIEIVLDVSAQFIQFSG